MFKLATLLAVITLAFTFPPLAIAIIVFILVERSLTPQRSDNK